MAAFISLDKYRSTIIRMNHENVHVQCTIMALSTASKDGTSRFVNCRRLKRNFELLDNVTSATARLLSRADKEDAEDPFAELEEDEYDLRVNEVVMEDC